jgi:hypothetical protein
MGKQMARCYPSAALGLLLLLTSSCTGIVDGPPSGSSGPGGVGTPGVGSPGPGGVTDLDAAANCQEAPSPRLLRQLTREEYRKTVADLLALTEPDVSAVPPDATVRGFTNNVTVAFVTPAHMDAFLRAGGQLAKRAVQESYAGLVGCVTEDAACAADFVNRLGQRAFRRPLTNEEQSRYVQFFDPGLTGGDFKTGVALAIQALLVAPQFLLRSELGADAGDGRFQLTPYELATSLSYTLWGTLPDNALFASAASGALANRTELEAQARRLLADPRGRERVSSFFYEWLEVPKMFVASKDEATFPALAADRGGVRPLQDAMKAEHDAFVTHVVFDSTRGFEELFTADYSFVNDRLALLYGLPAPGSPEQVVQVPLGAGSPRGGLLTMGALLFGHARTTSSSPTQRGHLIREALLCSDIPPPPPDVDPNVPPGAAGKTARQQITNLTGTGVCAGCHQLMDPIGFGLEGFDAIGQFRTTDNGEPVDATGEIVAIATPGAFDGPRELSQVLAASREAKACFVTNYYRFARGYDAKDVDVCALQQLQRDFVVGQLSIPDLFVSLVLKDSFSSRRSAEVLSP